MSTSTPEPARTPESAPSPARAAAPETDGPPVVRAVEVADESRRRRAPRYGRFGLVGFVVGAFVSLALTLLPIGDSDLGQRDLFLLLVLGLGTAGVFAGLTVAYLLDRRSLRRRSATD